MGSRIPACLQRLQLKRAGLSAAYFPITAIDATPVLIARTAGTSQENLAGQSDCRSSLELQSNRLDSFSTDQTCCPRTRWRIDVLTTEPSARMMNICFLSASRSGPPARCRYAPLGRSFPIQKRILIVHRTDHIYRGRNWRHNKAVAIFQRDVGNDVLTSTGLD